MKRKYLIFYSLGTRLVIENRISMKILQYLGAGGTTYRYIWLIPIIPVIAYVMLEILMKQSVLWDKGCMLLLFLGLLYFTGSSDPDAGRGFEAAG